MTEYFLHVSAIRTYLHHTQTHFQLFNNNTSIQTSFFVYDFNMYIWVHDYFKDYFRFESLPIPKTPTIVEKIQEILFHLRKMYFVLRRHDHFHAN